MGKDTKIAWAHHTFNLVWGCTRISAGCKYCYAATLSAQRGYALWNPTSQARRTFGTSYWHEPLRWNRAAAKLNQRHRVFCSSMCDVFEDNATVAQEREKLWPLIKATPYLDWLILTKRPARIRTSLPDDWSIDTYPNVWLGTSIESNKYVRRASILARVPATVHFISCEPALGPVPDLPLHNIQWVIYGGESGPVRREHDLQWARDLHAMCKVAHIPFFYKQASARFTESSIRLDGEIVREFPTEHILVT